MLFGITTAMTIPHNRGEDSASSFASYQPGSIVESPHLSTPHLLQNAGDTIPHSPELFQGLNEVTLVSS